MTQGLGEVTCKAKLLFPVADFPAKEQYNGRYGCHYCKLKGTQVNLCVFQKINICDAFRLSIFMLCTADKKRKRQYQSLWVCTSCHA